MLSFVGSEIDEVRMDHLNFVKIYNKTWGAFSNYNTAELIDKGTFTDIIEIDEKIESLVSTDINRNPSNPTSFVGMTLPLTSSTQLKALAFLD
jgi:hypothetical protein